MGAKSSDKLSPLVKIENGEFIGSFFFIEK